MSDFPHVTQSPGARPVRIWTDDVEPEAMKQLINASQLPFIHPHGVVAMPDVHYGIGATVGSVIVTARAVIPAAVGVDIGCGMNAVRTSLTASDLPDSLTQLRHDIERGVPLGPGAAHGEDQWPDRNLFDRLDDLPLRDSKVSLKNAGKQIGTLGGGNHFIEVCLDESQNVWVMLHSGSRGIGNQIGRHFITKARERMEEYFITLPDKDLAYFPENTQDFRDYVEAVTWAQDYALTNRKAMLDTVLRALHHSVKPFELTTEAVNCHHNYIERESHFGQNVLVTRKGAIRAREGDMGIIPGSMGQRSYIVRGKGNADSYHSCSHGAGRRMSRTEANKQFTVDDLIAQTQGVECRKDKGVIDEIPGAYKDIDVVMKNQEDLVEVVHTLKQVLCIKGN
jgi:tRNA-splicing ligase RtcB